METGFTIDTREFSKALRDYAETTRKTAAQIVNQRAYNVAGRAIDMLKPSPGEEQSTRARIKSYLQQRRGSDRFLITKTGKKSKKRVRKSLQLILANLIVQKRRAKAGLKGLYGREMVDAEGKFTRVAQAGVGFLKSPFAAVIRALTKYQPPGLRMKIRTRWGDISIWPGSRGSAKVIPALPGTRPIVTMSMFWNVPGQPTKVERLTRYALQRGFDLEEAELVRHMTEVLQKEADKINARK